MDAGVRRQRQDLFKLGEIGQRASGEYDTQLDRVERRDFAAPNLSAALASRIERSRHPPQEVCRRLRAQSSTAEKLRQQPRRVVLGRCVVGSCQAIQLGSRVVLELERKAPAHPGKP